MKAGAWPMPGAREAVMVEAAEMVRARVTTVQGVVTAAMTALERVMRVAAARKVAAVPHPSTQEYEVESQVQ